MSVQQQSKQALSYSISFLGAAGVALQNYTAVNLLITGIGSVLSTLTTTLSGFAHTISVLLGGLCSGTVNFFINVSLLDSFLKRFWPVNDEKHRATEWGAWEQWPFWKKCRAVAGIAVFVVTGLLFGMTAFAFGVAGPLAALALAAGIFVSLIMIIQEVETWLLSFDTAEPNSISGLFAQWKETLTINKAWGHCIAIGNVIALSLTLTLGLAETLIALNVAALPAFIVGVTIAFTFGAFTEFYFYNFFLASFCEKIKLNWEKMQQSKWAPFGFACITINAIVNAALTYSGVMLLTGLLTLAGIALPPVGLMVAIATGSALFAAGASFFLGMDFWIGRMHKPTSLTEVTTTLVDAAAALEGSYAKSWDSSLIAASSMPADIANKPLVVAATLTRARSFCSFFNQQESGACRPALGRSPSCTSLSNHASLF